MRRRIGPQSEPATPVVQRCVSTSGGRLKSSRRLAVSMVGLTVLGTAIGFVQAYLRVPYIPPESIRPEWGFRVEITGANWGALWGGLIGLVVGAIVGGAWRIAAGLIIGVFIGLIAGFAIGSAAGSDGFEPDLGAILGGAIFGMTAGGALGITVGIALEVNRRSPLVRSAPRAPSWP